MGLFSSQKQTHAQTPPVAISALNVQQSSYGVPVAILYGTNRVSGNMIWYGDFVADLVTEGGGGGGGGKGGLFGGGGSGGGTQTYYYYASFMFGLCEGTIKSIGTVWASKEITTLSAKNGVFFTGAVGQSPWGYLLSKHSSEADSYSGLAYIAFQNYSLGTSAETPQISAEASGLLSYTNAYAGQDALADEVITDFLERAGFPSSYLDIFTDARNYWLSMGFFISPAVDEQRQAMEWLKEWMDTLNAEFVWSEDKLSIVPYADVPVAGNGASFTPDMTPKYDLDESHFICGDDEDPITIERENLADAYNRLPIEYNNRANQYNIETFTAEDPAHIDQYGVRTAPTLACHHVSDPNLAQTMAYLKLWRSTYIDKGNIYRFKLPWNFIRLDPMDLVTLTDSGLGLSRKLVRIKKISEDEDGVLEFEAEDVPGAIALPALYSTQSANRYTADYNVDPVIVYE